MNENTFRLVFSKHLGMLVPVGEQQAAHRKNKISSARKGDQSYLKAHKLKALSVSLMALGVFMSTSVLALPTGPTVANGSASFQQTGSTLTVTNSPSAIINWGSFSIGQNEVTRFVQQSSASAVLNRVIGPNPSQILGQLQSNGRVFLINPNGILFGAGSRVDTAGFIASTLNLSDADFLGGKLKFTGTGTEGRVENQGTINTANGGFVYLIAPNVENNGIINAPNGDVLLAAGQSVEIADGLNPALRVQITSPDGQVTNLGQILAESGRIGLHGGLVANTGVINASSAVTEGGKIYLRAINKIELADTSTISADGTSGGEVTAIVQNGGRISGELLASGEISAQGNGASGSGGFVDTSAGNVKIADGFLVKTRGGEWLIDPADFTIASSGGNITGAALSSSLNSSTGGGVTILSSSGTSGGSGDINVNDTVSWGANNLTLTAARDININAVMTASGTASLTMNTATTNGVGNAPDVGVTGGTVKVGFNPDGTFKGRVDLSTGTALSINGATYTIINNLNALQGMSSNLAGAYALGSNIASAAGFSPVGNDTTPFTGIFEGLGHTINALSISQPTQGYVGLFGQTDSDSAIRNVGITNASVTGGWYTGGLVGYNFGSVSNSYFSGSVTAGNWAGGLLGGNEGGTVSGSYARGSVSASSNGYNLGGLIGANSGGSISNSYASVSVSTGSDSSNIGGLVGDNDDAPIANSYATGNVTAGSRSSKLGGLVGNANGTATINNSYATGTVTGSGNANSVGGLVGSNDGGAISNSYASGNVLANYFGAYVGGLVGFNATGAISNSYALGSVTIGNGINADLSGYSVGFIGGLVGSSGRGSSITSSYATGNVNGESDNPYIGGFVGRSYASISNSYSTGKVTTLGFNDYVGGFVGENSGSINSSYSSGEVAADAFGSSYIGAFVGFGSSGRTPITNSFYSKTVNPNLNGISGSVDVAGVVWGLSDSDLRLAANFNTSTAANGNFNNNWDFTSVWTVDSGAFSSHPYLRSNVQNPSPSQRSLGSTCGVCTWDGGGGNSLWSLAANWSGDLLPASASSVTIGGGYGSILFDVGSLSISSLSLSSPLNILGGNTLTLTGTGTFNAAVSGAGTLAISGATVNAGANAINVANLNLAAGSLIGNGNLTVSNDFIWTAGTLGNSFQSLSLTKQGNFNIGGISAVGAITLDAQGGGNLTLTGNISKTGGATATLNLSADGTIGIDSGVTIAMAGSGNTMTFDAPGGVTNNGTISPGGNGAIGTLNVIGDLTLGANSILNLDLGGTAASQSDKVMVTGNVTMGGTLNRFLVGGYTPTLGDAIPFINMGGRASGTFATENALAYMVTGYQLAPGEASRQIFSGPNTNTFTNRIGGLTWETAGNWSAGYIPDYTQTAIVSSSPLSPVVHSIGTDNIAGLLINAGNALSVTGGSLSVSGTSNVGGTFSLSNTGTYSNDGTLDITGTLNLLGGTFSGAGAINISGGTLNVPSDSTVNWVSTGTMANSGTMSLSNQSITNAITNNGTLNSGGGLTFTQPFTNNGIFNANSGVTTFTDLVSTAPISGFTQGAGSLVLNGGNIAGNLELNAGALKGSGTITGNVRMSAATLAPGFSPGTLNINGNLNLSSASTTSIEIWGTGSGQFDVINVSGSALLAGALNVTTGNGYVPGIGHSLRFMTFGSSSGNFGSTSIPSGMSLSRLSSALDLLGPSYSSNILPTSVINALVQINTTTNMGALSYDTPLLYASGQSSYTASSSGTLTQTAEMVLPALMPELEPAEQQNAPPGSSFASVMPLLSQLILDSSRQDFSHESRLICR